MLNIGEFVRREKELHGVTLEQLYKLTGIKPSHLSRLINDPPRNPDVDTVERIAKAFHYQPSDVWKEISSNGPSEPPPLDVRLARRLEPLLMQVEPDKRSLIENAIEQVTRAMVFAP